jgi:hypothetical protein
VAVAVAVAVGVALALGVGVTVGIGVGLTGGVGVGVTAPVPGPWISSIVGSPVLKYPTVALAVWGGWSASNRNVYMVAQRIAFAFWLVAKVSVLQVIEFASWVTSHGVLLNPASPCVPSCGQPGC